jgi:hypothetical protein
MKEYSFEGAQDWHHYFKIIFDNFKVRNMLEFGLGNGTEFLLDHCNTVTSVEISLGDYNKSWYSMCLKKYSHYNNWNPIYIEACDEIREANEIAQKNRYPISYNKHLSKLEEITDLVLSDHEYDAIFVDAGIHNRGDILNLVMGKAPIIAAHDSSRDENRILKNIYGYNIVRVPSDYLEFHFEDTYMGTTIWVKKDFNSNVISSLSGRLNK